ncbi:anti-sigma regulatory factor (Ser/Thr protein kinase) [Kitasatospora sp. MAP12-15]|uniref:ATP-binding protein n=1 Tax=unclassified Kitasatospora TaxID=2633591 RepID=UPI002476A316|nr:ATP-binding protein [Kitasatospora sp. MAP12-44]MDH6111391.1 anti-sigma regulatory factor (Ser/Thr protein kinase) [Kitasatospora sp. MAP12-44]
MPESLRPAQPGAQVVQRQPLRLVLHIGPSVEDARDTRRALIEGLRAWQLPLTAVRLAELEVCAGEVIANAVQHTGKPSTLTAQWTGEFVRVELQDADPRIPRRRTDTGPDNDAESGRGLDLLQGFADRWGVIPPTGRRADGTSTGKTVWFECGADGPPMPLPATTHAADSRQVIRLERAG